MNTSPSLRRVATVSTAALVASIVTALPSSAATSAPLNYDCVSSFFTDTFTVTADTDLPATATAGAPVTGTATYTIVLPGVLSGSSPIRFIEGSAVISATAFGAPVTVAATVPKVAVPASGDVSFVASGALTATAPATVGPSDIVAGDFTMVLDPTTADGSPGPVPRVEYACTLAAGQNAVVDTVAVVAAPIVKVDSTMKTKAKYVKNAHKAKVKVRVKGADGAVGSGKVKIVVKRGKKKVKSVAKKLNEKGVAKLVLKKLKKGKYTVKVKYAGSDTQDKSRAKATFRVK